MNPLFELKSKFEPAGDQPTAIKQLIEGIDAGLAAQTLLGVTGSGKTFTIAKVIEKVQRPTLVMVHNKPWQRSYMVSLRSFSLIIR